MVVMSTEWTIANKLLTPTMKIKRNDIEKIYKNYYPKWYESNARIVFALE